MKFLRPRRQGIHKQVDGIAARAIVHLIFLFDKRDHSVRDRPTSHQFGDGRCSLRQNRIVQRQKTTGIPSINVRTRVDKGIDDSNIFIKRGLVQRRVPPPQGCGSSWEAWAE